MCCFSLDGDLEVQERKPRYPGEPKHKRLAFVKDRGSRSSDYWDVVPYRGSNRSSTQEMWQQPHHEPQPHFGQQPQYGQPPMNGQEPQYGQPPMYGQGSIFGQQPQHGHQQQHGHQPFHQPQAPAGAIPPPLAPLPSPGFQQRIEGGPGHDHGIVQMRGAGAGAGPHDHDRHGRGDQIQYIEEGPRARMPRHLRHDTGRGRSSHRNHRRRGESVFSYDDDDDSFGSGQRLFRRPRSVMTADSDDSFMTVSGPQRLSGRRDSRYRR